jgi:uncharacterized membrane protein YccC
MTDDPLKTTRQFRRLRSQFKADLGLDVLTRADRVLIDQCALLALRARQMRDAILSGEKEVSDEDLVRSSNACIRMMTALRNRKGRDEPTLSTRDAIMLAPIVEDDDQ